MGSTSASAAGGLFDNVSNDRDSVAVVSENILLVVGAGHVELHIELRLSGGTETMGWLIPVPPGTEFAVGSQRLFDGLVAATSPSYELALEGSRCDAPEDIPAQTPTEPQDGIPAWSVPAVGLFEGRTTSDQSQVEILEAETAAEVFRWFEQSSVFQRSPLAEALIDAYIARGSAFAAIVIKNPRSLTATNPIRLRWPGAGLSFPLQMSQVSSASKTHIRVFVIADGLAASGNYRHVELNDLAIDWFARADNYLAVIDKATADPGVSNRRAFVTEYAGPLDLATASVRLDHLWDPQPFATLAWYEVVEELERQGAMTCFPGSGCEYFHPLVLELLLEFIPPPPGLDPASFYPCLSCQASAFDEDRWEPVRFARAFDDRIAQPAAHARQLLAPDRMLTRLSTVISPQNMQHDPEFVIRTELSPVNAVHQGIVQADCWGGAVVSTPTGLDVYIPPGAVWPSFPERMPAARQVLMLPDSGAMVAVTDNGEEIDDTLARYHATLGWNPGRGCSLSAPVRGQWGRWLLWVIFATLGQRQRSPTLPSSRQSEV